jgi:pyruvate dehydrogenase E1 component alpha subunit
MNERYGGCSSPHFVRLPELYRQMLRARTFEIAVAGLWERGLISGEMHLGTGEEAVAAGVVTHLRDGDGLSLAHRVSPALIVRGVSMVSLLREYLGKPDGICRGRGGHMHVFSRQHLAANSGIVGASVPIGVGFALAAKRLRTDAVAVAFTGEGALNQGMLLEALNLAAVWSLPILLVCIDNRWAITTRSATVTAGHPADRLRAFGWAVDHADGTDVQQVYRAAGGLLDRCRAGKGPVALYVTCPRLDGHMLGDELIAQAHALTGRDTRRTLGRVMSAAIASGGGPPLDRVASVARMIGTIARAHHDSVRGDRDDPIIVVRRAMQTMDDELRQIDADVESEVAAAVAAAVATESPDA